MQRAKVVKASRRKPELGQAESEPGMSESGGLYVHLLPAWMPAGAVRGGLAVVIDVLRATSVIATALRHGCEAVIPCQEIDEARAVAARLPEGACLLGGERGGLRIEGFDLGNSPSEYSEARCRGRTLVLTTTNGTRAVRACLEAREVFAAGFVNLAATAQRLRQLWRARPGEAIHLVCAGTDGEPSLEDTLLAGALALTLSHRGDSAIPLQNDAARLAAAAAPRAYAQLPSLLAEGLGGRNLKALGLEDDIQTAARVDSMPIVAVLRPGEPSAAFRVG